MIFDSDSHMSPYRNHDKAIDAASLNRLFEEAGVDRALTWLMPQGVKDVSESNKYIYESAKTYKRFMPFGWANPKEGLDKAIADVKRCLLDYAFPGVKLNGAQNGYLIDSPEAMTVCEEIAKLGGIIAFHIGVDFPDNTHPNRAANVAKAFPETTVLMVHMGGCGDPDVGREVIELAKVHKNMVLVGSSIDISRVKLAIDELGAERVLFASDSPFHSFDDSLKDYTEMLSAYDDDVKNAVMYKNAIRVFGL